MKKDKNRDLEIRTDIYTFVGIFIFVLVTVVDRFFIRIEDTFYLPIMLIALVVIIIGFVEGKRPVENK